MRVYWIGVFTGIEGSVTKRKRLSSTWVVESQQVLKSPKALIWPQIAAMETF